MFCPSVSVGEKSGEMGCKKDIKSKNGTDTKERPKKWKVAWSYFLYQFSNKNRSQYGHSVERRNEK